jgi:filamentous hemagglutinin
VPTSVYGFIDNMERDNHFQLHGNEFNPMFASAAEYEAAAIAFLTGPLAGSMECVRRNGDTIRFDPATDEFAICDRDGVLKTYYKPSPSIHKQKDNTTYFRGQCKK